MKLQFLLLIQLIAVTSCKKHEPKIEENAKFVKVWFDTVKSTPFTAKLIIKKDSTFEYTGGACTSSFGSKGIWRIENDTLILNSIYPKECMWKHDFGLICEKLASDDYKTIKGCDPKDERAYEHFENDKFYFRNDTLIHKNDENDKMENCPNAIIAFSDKQKIRK